MIELMKKLIFSMLVLCLGWSVPLHAAPHKQAAPEITKLATALQATNGRFSKLPEEMKKWIEIVPTAEFPREAVENAIIAASEGVDAPDEEYAGMTDNSVVISNQAQQVVGYLFVPTSYLPIPEGDTDYHVATYVFYDKDFELVTKFRIYVPVY